MEIQSGAVAKSYMTNGLLIYGELVVHPFLIYDFANAPLLKLLCLTQILCE
jgi:hypothetical protein